LVLIIYDSTHADDNASTLSVQDTDEDEPSRQVYPRILWVTTTNVKFLYSLLATLSACHSYVPSFNPLHSNFPLSPVHFNTDTDSEAEVIDELMGSAAFEQSDEGEDSRDELTDDDYLSEEDDFHLTDLHIEVNNWAAIWGGLLSWTFQLEVEFQEVYMLGSDAVDQWSEKVWSHADVGRCLLDKINSWEDVLPKNPRMVKLLWKHYQHLHWILVRGITIIETRVDALQPGIFTVSTAEKRLRVYGPDSVYAPKYSGSR